MLKFLRYAFYIIGGFILLVIMVFSFVTSFQR